jgi:hypothetical protein
MLKSCSGEIKRSYSADLRRGCPGESATEQNTEKDEITRDLHRKIDHRIEIAEDGDPGDCSQRAPASALGFDHAAREDNQRRQRGNHNHGCNRDPHLDSDFRDRRMSLVLTPPQLQKSLGRSEGNRSQPIPAPKRGRCRMACKPNPHRVNRPSNSPSLPILPIRLSNARVTASATPPRNQDVPEFRLLRVGNHQDDRNEQSQAGANQTTTRPS